MSNYRMNISGDIGLSEFSSINDYIALVGEEDKLIVTTEGLNKDKLNTLCKILENNDLEIDISIEDNSEKYNIKALKNKNNYI